VFTLISVVNFYRNAPGAVKETLLSNRQKIESK